MDFSRLLETFIIIYTELIFLTHTDVYRSLIWLPKLRTRKIDKTVSKLQNSVLVIPLYIFVTICSNQEAFHLQIRIPGQIQCHVAHGHVSLQLFPVVWILPRSSDVICYKRLVITEGHKNNFKDRCHMNAQPTFLFLTYFLTQ